MRSLALFALFFVFPTSYAEEAGSKNSLMTIRPVLLERNDSDGASLGIDYDLKKELTYWSSTIVDPGGPSFPKGVEDSTTYSAQARLRARGSLASSASKNPNKLLDFSANTDYVINTLPAYYQIGVLLGYETDQSRENHQSLYAANFSVTKLKIFSTSDIGTFQATYGKVVPSADIERKKVFNRNDSYQRFNFEFSYTIPLLWQYVTSIDLNARYYKEVSAPEPVRLADLDEHKLGLIRINLQKDFFIQYSAGSLPFDQRSARTVKFGWTMKLQ